MSLAGAPLVRDWLRSDGAGLVVRTGKVDFGQRISTALARIAAEELDMPLAGVSVAPVRTGDSPDEGMTSGSNSLVQSGNAVRLAAATARKHLLRAAARELDVVEGELVLSEGFVTHRGSNRKLALADLFHRLDPQLAVDVDAATRPAGEIRRADAPPMGMREMAEGRYVFLHDMRVPGMMHARPVHPPHPHARLGALDADAVAGLRAAGIEVIRDGSFLAVAGPAEWPVVQGAGRLAAACSWEMGAGLETGDVFELLETRPARRMAVIDGTPQPEAALPAQPAEADLAAEFRRPYQIHGALAPSAAMAQWAEDHLTVHSHSQGIYPLRESIAESLDLDPAAVTLAHVPGSGCYGHNGADDAALEAALVARALPGRPVLLKWSRDDEHAWEPCTPAMRVRVAAKLDAGGDVADYFAEAAGDTHRGRPRAGPDRAGPARLIANRLRADPPPPYRAAPNMNRHGGNHRNLEPLYGFARTGLVKALVPDLPLRSSAMRCLGAVANVFALESLMDELAARAGVGPIAYRRRQLRAPRDRAVLDRLEARLAALSAPADGAGRGIAFAQYKNLMARVALAVDLRVDDRAAVHLQRAIIVADAGRVVDPDGLRAQLEGGFIQGASWALFEAVAWDRDGILTRDWESYPVIRFSQIPEIEVILVEPPDTASLGAGEATPGPAVAAIANAIHAATGLRLRRMPFDADAITAAALAE